MKANPRNLKPIIRKRSITPKKNPYIQKEDKNFDNNLQLIYSIYSIINSNYHSSLNILASIFIVTNSAYAFISISLGYKNIFISFIMVYILSLIFYIFSIVYIFKYKLKIKNMIINRNKTILEYLHILDNCNKVNLFITSLSFMSSVGFLLLCIHNMS